MSSSVSSNFFSFILEGVIIKGKKIEEPLLLHKPGDKYVIICTPTLITSALFSKHQAYAIVHMLRDDNLITDCQMEKLNAEINNIDNSVLPLISPQNEEEEIN